MADLKYTVQVDTAQAKRNIGSLKNTIVAAGSALAGAFAIKEITNVSARFEDLRTTLGILYKDVDTGAAAFDQIKEFATQSVFAVEDLTDSVIKLKGAGLNPTIDQLTLFADVASVSADSVGALQAITDLYARTTAGGLGLEELNRLGDRGIPVFTILAEKLGINRLEISELGKTAEGSQTILRALEEGMEEAFGGASAARTKNLSQAFSNFGDAVDNAFDAIGQAGLNEALAEATNSITTFISENEALIKSLGEGLGAAITFVIDNAKILTQILAGAFAAAIAAKVITIAGAVYKLSAAFKKAAITGTILQGVTGIGLVKVAAGIAAAGGAVLAIEKLTGDASEAIEGMDDSIEGLADNDKKSSGPLTDDATKKIDEHAKALRDVLAPHKKFIDQAKEFADTDYRTELEKANQRVTDAQIVIEQLNLAFERSNGQVDNFVGLLRGAQNELKAATADVDELNQAAADLANQGTFAEFYDDLITGTQEAEQEIQFTKQAVEKLKEDFYSGAISIQVYASALDQMNEALGQSDSALSDLISTSLDFQKDIRESTQDAQRSFDQLSLSPLERELDDIKTTLTRDLKDTTRELERAMRLNPELSADYEQEIKNLTEATNEAIIAQQELARQSYETQRSFEYGWSRAFDEYQDNATNAAMKAEKIFDKTTQGMEDMIVNFAKTGKLEFKTFVADMLETLLRSQLQQSIANIFSLGNSGGGGGGLGGLFAGFFANGGLIPGGTFGVVGENGPELVTGPAQVTPMTGGGQVTYNISAVDAMSFKQMVARDPGFIHSVASQGGKSIPVRR